MADATVTLGLNAAQLTAGLRAASSNVDKFAKGASSSFSRLSASLGVLGGGFTLGAIVKQGFSFNQTMQDGEVAISNVLKTFKGLNDEAARSEAAKVVQLIAEAEPRAAGGLKELTQAFIATAAAAASAGISAEQNVDLVARFANALSNSGMPLEQLNQELRSVLTNNVTSDSFVGMLLQGKGLDSGRITQLTQEGKLYGEIVKQLGAMGEAGDTAAVAFSTLNSALSKAAGALTADMFSDSVSGAKSLSVAVDENIQSFQYLGKALGDVIDLSVKGIGLAAEFFQFNNAIGTAFGELITGGNPIEAFNETMDGFKADVAKAASAATKGAGASSTSGGSSAGGSVSNIVEKQKKDTYDIAKNIQEQAKAAQSILDPYRQLLDYLEQEKKKLDDIKAKKDADKQAAQVKTQGQKEAAQALQDEIRLLEVRAGGNEEAIKAAERELALKQKAREIQTQLQTDAKTALDIAKQMQALEDKAQKAKDRPEGRIQGYSSERQGGVGAARGRAAQRAADSAAKRAGAYSRGFEGLDPAYARGDFGYFDDSREAALNSNFEAGRYYKPDRPINPTANADAMNANQAGSTSPVVGSIQQLEQTIKAILSVD